MVALFIASLKSVFLCHVRKLILLYLLEKTADSHFPLSTCAHMKAFTLLTLFSHFCEWLRLHNKRGRGGEGGQLHALDTLSTASADPMGGGHPWPCRSFMTNKPGHGTWRGQGGPGWWNGQFWPDYEWKHRCHCIVQVMLLQSCLPPSLSVDVLEKKYQAVERSWESESMACHFDIHVEKL